jgi:hypothetical protein
MRNKLAGLFVGISLVLGLTAPVYAQSTVQQQINNGLCSGSNLQIPTSSSGGSCSTTGGVDINNILRHMVNVLSAIIGVVAVIMIIFGGFRYITSGGSDTSVTSAKNTILYAIVGLVIVALSQALVRFVIKALGS